MFSVCLWYNYHKQTHRKKETVGLLAVVLQSQVFAFLPAFVHSVPADGGLLSLTALSLIKQTVIIVFIAGEVFRPAIPEDRHSGDPGVRVRVRVRIRVRLVLGLGLGLL